ncbi:polysaccharide biosynthesis protein [Legionella impletisoli]|uniref:Multidrug MFS transporter n=1 Tax=Legionella impletisoli TaxID=343510 RepID=A0A917N9E5_9GAMM|nr:nucleoside-diphosphate sugar epimerase/dehydratase [Legionella impletisoli]GGI80156.1 multidrug MFS transporter [Legionella impletisoli]
MEKLVLYWQKIYFKLPVLLFDILSVPLAWYLAYWFRYNLESIPKNPINKQSLLPLAILMVIQVGCYYHFKVYRGIWRFSSINDVERIIRAVVCSILAIIPVFYITSLLHDIPRSILPLYGINLIALLCGARLALRLHMDKHQLFNNSTEMKRVLIIGAGRAGEGLIRDLKRTDTYVPIGIVDDSPNKKGVELHGVQVLGTIADLNKLVNQYHADLIFIAIPSASSAAMRRIVHHCELSEIPFRTLPSLSALASGHVQVNALREVNIEDLLGRDQVELNWDSILNNIKEKKILVTGGGGSIGSELCRQVMMHAPNKLLIMDNSEFNLYQIERELKEKHPNAQIEIALVSVCDEIGVEAVFNQFKPEIVFHAAAFKHVPMLEHQVRLAVQNNILGTQIVAEASVTQQVSKFILISSDKAVNPTNIMGVTKRVAEIFCQNLQLHCNTKFITVRFGNVLGSTGSVIPLFKSQIQKGGPLTVTHPDIERYFMTIAEACQLILQAMANGTGGEIFVLDMGEPIKIKYLAEQMIRLSGKEPGKDIAIEYVGLRPGEKLFEELFHQSEQLDQTEHKKLFKAKFRQIDWVELKQAMRLLKNACLTYEEDELLLLLKNLVPEYQVRNQSGAIVKGMTFKEKI